MAGEMNSIGRWIMSGEFTMEERIRRLMNLARSAESRGESALARALHEMAEDLRPAPAMRLAR